MFIFMFNVDIEKENFLKEKLDVDLVMMEEILDGLGLWYVDWIGRRFVLVDGDFLLSLDFEFKCFFRLLLYGVKFKFNNFELIEL